MENPKIRKYNYFSRHMGGRTYNFSAKSGIKRLSSLEVLARGGGRKVLRSEISSQDAKRLWEDFGFTVLKSAKKKSAHFMKELKPLKLVYSEDKFNKIIAILGEKRVFRVEEKKTQNYYLVLRKHEKREIFCKRWEVFREKEERECKRNLEEFKQNARILKKDWGADCYYCALFTQNPTNFYKISRIKYQPKKMRFLVANKKRLKRYSSMLNLTLKSKILLRKFLKTVKSAKSDRISLDLKLKKKNIIFAKRKVLFKANGRVFAQSQVIALNFGKLKNEPLETTDPLEFGINAKFERLVEEISKIQNVVGLVSEKPLIMRCNVFNHFVRYSLGGVCLVDLIESLVGTLSARTFFEQFLKFNQSLGVENKSIIFGNKNSFAINFELVANSNDPSQLGFFSLEDNLINSSDLPFFNKKTLYLNALGLLHLNRFISHLIIISQNGDFGTNTMLTDKFKSFANFVWSDLIKTVGDKPDFFLDKSVNVDVMYKKYAAKVVRLKLINEF